jgi:NAD dependent epimerase/dehydratase
MNLAGKKVLITGADGFIGSHLVERLIDTGAEVKAFCYYNSFNSRGWLEDLHLEKQSAYECLMGDVRDHAFVNNALKQVDVVFHLASLIAIPYSYQASRSYIDTNIIGGHNILQAALDHGVQKVLMTSTSEVYGTARYTPIDEQHPKQGQSPYSATKIAIDALTESFYKTYDLPVVTVRPFNTYGPRQSKRAIIPTIITQLLNGEKQIQLGALHPTRDFVFVKDTVEGFLKLAESDRSIGQSVNIATSQEISMEQLAHTIIQLIEPNASIQTDKHRLRPESSEVDQLLGSNELLKTFTNWAPQTSLEAGLQQTIEWFKQPEHLIHYKGNDYTL